MTDTPFDRFGEFAAHADNFLEISGRLNFHGEAEKHALHDIIRKLALTPEDDLLEIGCGVGNLLLPLSFLVHTTTGVDHGELLKKMEARLPIDRSSITLVSGNFLTAKVQGSYSKILIYSVIHYLRDEKELTKFMGKATKLLRPGGIMVIGDIPNVDKKARFLASEEGKRFLEEWQKKIASAGAINHPKPSASPLIQITDEVVARMIQSLKESGMTARVVAQPEGLPISHTREDLIVERT